MYPAKNTKHAMMSEDVTDTEFEQRAGASEPAEQLSLFVNLDGFEGPIDLLLSLAREQKVDLGKIAILPLAEQYLSYIASARKLNLEVAADYLVMAAWLAFLKSRLLLPDPEPEQADDAIDMTDALRFQLVRLEAMQSASKRLASLPVLGKNLKNTKETAKLVGKEIAQRAKNSGISEVYFDRGGFLYHGRVKALADAAREGGLKF